MTCNLSDFSENRPTLLFKEMGHEHGYRDRTDCWLSVPWRYVMQWIRSVHAVSCLNGVRDQIEGLLAAHGKAQQQGLIPKDGEVGSFVLVVRQGLDSMKQSIDAVLDPKSKQRGKS